MSGNNKCPRERVNAPGAGHEEWSLMSATSSQGKPGAFTATKVTGIYRRNDATGKPGKAFYVRYTRQDGKRTFEAAGSFEDAKRRLAEVQGRITRGEVVGNASTTLSQVIQDWQAIRNVKPRTAEAQDSHLRLYIRPRLGRMKVREVNRAAVLKWLSGLKRQDGREGALSDGTKAAVLSTLSSILDLAVDDDLISVNPVRVLGRKQKPRQAKYEGRVLADGEMERLIAGVSQRRQWLVPIIRLTALTGLRLGEVCGLRWGDVDFEQNTLTIARQLGKNLKFGSLKGGVPYAKPMLPAVRSLLAELKLAGKDTGPDDPVFVSRCGGHRLPADVQRAFVQARDAAGLAGFRFHDLRHTCVSLLMNAPGAKPTAVQHYVGHASLATTLRYAHWVEQEEWSQEAETALAGLGG